MNIHNKINYKGFRQISGRKVLPKTQRGISSPFGNLEIRDVKKRLAARQDGFFESRSTLPFDAY